MFMLGLAPFIGIVYSAIIAFLIYFGIKVFAGRRKRQILEAALRPDDDDDIVVDTNSKDDNDNNDTTALGDKDAHDQNGDRNDEDNNGHKDHRNYKICIHCGAKFNTSKCPTCD